LEKTQFSPLKVFESLKNNAEIQAKDKGLDFRFSISNDVPKLVEGDENRLVQILNNVLSNAIKFTPAGNVNFVISLLVKKESKVSFIMKVSDSGWESQKKNRHYF
jgi:signal transduction histidine kinase